jgi:hypothetical protein
VIDFRYHLVSLVAVFLALALGLFIGSTTLRPKVAQDLKNRTDRLSAANHRLSGDLSTARQQVKDGLDFEDAVLPYVLNGRLSAQTVVIVSLPDAESSQRDDVRAALEAAGAVVTGDIRLRDALLDPAQDAFLTTLTDRVALPGRALPETSGNDRALALLANVLGRRPLPSGSSVSTAAAERVVAAYAAGDLLSVSGDPPRPASLAVVIAGPASEGEASPTPSPDTDTVGLSAAFARYLDEAAAGAVVAGPAAAADEGGVIDLIRSQKALRTNVSTVDGLELPRGAIATVLALAEQREGRAGGYGDGDGATPLPTPSRP